MHHVLITGGAGFIGTHLCERLVAMNASRIVVYDNFSSGNRAHERWLRNVGVELIEGDIADIETLRMAAKGADTIFHLAANPDIAKAVTQPDIDFWQGTLLAQNVFEAARASGTVQEIYYTSGSGVYGDWPNVDLVEDFGPMRPISTYGASKLAAEALLCAYCHMFGLTARAFRFANVVGARQTHGVGFDFMRRLRTDPNRLRILGDGTQSKSYIHVSDVLDAIFAAAANCRESYDVFNVATGDYITVKEIAELAVEIADLRPGSVRFEFTGGDRGWKGDVPVVRFHCGKIQALGWRCARNSRQALAHAMQSMWNEFH